MRMLQRTIKIIAIGTVFVSIISSYMLFGLYFWLSYGFFKNIIQDNSGGKELKNTTFIADYLEGNKNRVSTEYFHKAQDASKFSLWFGIQLSTADILASNQGLSEDILCGKEYPDYSEVLSYCENILLDKKWGEMDENYNCLQFRNEKVRSSCQNHKNNILSPYTYDHCNNMDCRIDNIIFWVYTNKIDITSGCGRLKNITLTNQCHSKYERFLTYTKNPRFDEYFEKILQNKKLDRIESIVYKNIYSGYDSIPEKNCKLLGKEEDTRKCEKIYKDILGYIEKRKEYIQFQSILNTTIGER